MTFYFTDSTETPKSSVIDEILYNSEDKELLVVLNSGDFYGYEAVPENIYREFSKQDAIGGSTGEYWNYWIKPHFTRFDTGYIDVFKSIDDKDEDMIDLEAFSQLINEYVTVMNNDLVSKDTVSEYPVSFTAVSPSSFFTADLPDLRDEPVTKSDVETSFGAKPTATAIQASGEYLIAYEYEAQSASYEAELTLNAESAEAALALFAEIGKMAGWQAVKATAITTYLV